MSRPVPCDHIRAYYQRKWEAHKCIAYNLLRKGYGQWARGTVTDQTFNNLYEGDRL